MDTYGQLAEQCIGAHIPVRVLSSPSGYYIGTADENGEPLTRESEEYFFTKDLALWALHNNAWTQRRSF